MADIMRLKSLEIIGFKSFANKTKLLFPSNSTAVVGPNGSGKSNVADAIRWALGERDFRGLRVSKSEDIIFGGTPKKSRLSLAEVELSIDNSSKELDFDFDEIIITRKINRAGESVYKINKSPVRLKDIIELLAKAKIGYSGISIVNQGSADAILSASPKERRLMIEENLGLKEFQLKKESAKRKLISTSENLEQTRLLIDEILPHLRSLRRQVGRWEKREDIINKLVGLEKSYFSTQFQGIFLDKEKIEKDFAETKKYFDEIKREEELLEEKFKELEKNKPDFSQEFGDLRKKRGEIEKEKGEILRRVGHLEGQLEGLKRLPEKVESSSDDSDFPFSFGELKKIFERIKQLWEKSLAGDNLEKFRDEFNDIFYQINKKQEKNKEEDKPQENKKESEKEKSYIFELEKNKNELLDSIKKLDEKEEKINLEMTSLREKDELAGREFREVLNKLEQKRREISDWREKINSLEIKKERISIRQSDLEEKIRELGLNRDRFSEDELKNFTPDKEIDVNQVEGSIFRLRRELSSIGEVDELLVAEAKETEERHNFLSSELDDLEKAKGDLEAMEKELSEKIDKLFSSTLKNINDEFNKYFRLMFGGGRARLGIVSIVKKIKKSDDSEKEDESPPESDSDDLSVGETGIEFYLELPKKKVNSLEVLSGGERTLVSIAALFAIVSAVKPPFVVLDEVDAALDEANAKKVAKILEELSKETQFIIITHNRATMESAEALYGVTMTDEGVSKAVSLRLE